MRRRDERGGVAIMAAVTALVLIMAAAFAVDLGMQRVVRSDMQAVADVAALDMARKLSSTTMPGSVEWQDALEESLSRNDHNLGTPPAAAPGPGWVCTTDLCALAEAGWIDAQHDFVADPGPAPAGGRRAVQVHATAEVDFALAGGRGAATRAAVAAVAEPSVCFSVGTKLLSLDTSGSALSPLLEGMLGVRLGLDAVSYEGLVAGKNVTVDLVHLIPVLSTELGVGTVQELLDADIELVSFLEVTADALAAGGGDAAMVTVLRNLALAITDLGLSTGMLTPIGLGDILALDADDPLAGLTGDVNVLTLISAGILAANRDHALDADVMVPGVTGVTLTVIEPPKIVCGSPANVPAPTAEAAQIRLGITVPLGATNALGVTEGGVALTVKVAAGAATLDALTCSPDSVRFDVKTAGADATGLVTPQVTLGRFLSYIPGLGILLELAIKALGIDTVGLDVGVGASVASAEKQDVTIAYPQPPALPSTTVVTGSTSVLKLHQTSVGLTTGQSGIVTLLGALLNPTLSALTGGIVTPLVNTVVDPLLTSLVHPLLSALGITLGTADIDVLGRPDCGAVRLVG